LKDRKYIRQKKITSFSGNEMTTKQVQA